jgi:hypothetical protein
VRFFVLLRLRGFRIAHLRLAATAAREIGRLRGLYFGRIGQLQSGFAMRDGGVNFDLSS